MQKVSQEYLLLFNAITDAEESLCRLRARLMDAQRKAEGMYIAGNDAGPFSKDICGFHRAKPPVFRRPA